MNNNCKYAQYLRAVKDGQSSEGYLKDQLFSGFIYLKFNKIDSIKYYKDYNKNGYIEELKDLLKDIETGNVDHVIIYSSYIFEEALYYSKLLVETMEKYSCKLTVLNDEDKYFIRFISSLLDDGNLDRFYHDIDESAKLLSAYGNKKYNPSWKKHVRNPRYTV